ncbi:unnamed protein product, partial [Staurois parvus]
VHKPPFAAGAVNHQVPAGDYLSAPGDYRGSLTGRRAAFFTNSPPPSWLKKTALED